MKDEKVIAVLARFMEEVPRAVRKPFVSDQALYHARNHGNPTIKLLNRIACAWNKSLTELVRLMSED